MVEGEGGGVALIRGGSESGSNLLSDGSNSGLGIVCGKKETRGRLYFHLSELNQHWWRISNQIQTTFFRFCSLLMEQSVARQPLQTQEVAQFS